MTLVEWAARHNVTPAALAELSRVTIDEPATLEARNDVGTSEAAVQARTRVAVSRMGWRVWRNQVGACTMPDGSFVRFGLANDSHAINQSLKSGDLIGIRPIAIESRHLGMKIGQFVSLECKPADWEFRNTAREHAQAKWAQLVRSLGGHARFVTDERDVL